MFGSQCTTTTDPSTMSTTELPMLPTTDQPLTYQSSTTVRPTTITIYVPPKTTKPSALHPSTIPILTFLTPPPFVLKRNNPKQIYSPTLVFASSPPPLIKRTHPPSNPSPATPTHTYPPTTPTNARTYPPSRRYPESYPLFTTDPPTHTYPPTTPTDAYTKDIQPATNPLNLTPTPKNEVLSLAVILQILSVCTLLFFFAIHLTIMVIIFVCT